MSKLTHLPHIKNIKSGINKWDPMHSAVYELYFTLPDALQAEFKEDEAILTEQVTEVSGLDALQKTTGQGSQKFMGVDVSFQNPAMDTTYAEITVTMNLNLRNVTDAFVLKVFRAWENLNYDLSDGTRTLKSEYSSDSLRVAEANRNGEIWRSYIFHHVLLCEVTGLDTLNYTDNQARTIQVKFRSDFWSDDLA